MGTLKNTGLLIAGLVIFVYGTVNIRDAYLGRRWPTSEGVVVYSQVQQVGGVDPRRATFKPYVEYTYTVNSTRFKAKTISAGQNPAEFVLHQWGDYTSTKIYSERIVRRYPAGKTVMVYYNPRHPNIAQLEPGFSWWSFVALAVGAALAFWGARNLFTGREEMPNL